MLAHYPNPTNGIGAAFIIMPHSRPTAKRLNQSRTKDGKTIGQRLRASKEWRKARKAVLADEPLCWLCDQDGRTTIASQVHHIQMVERAPSLAFTRTNLAPLCSRCHGMINGMERSGRAGEAIELFEDYEPPEIEHGL